jgi:hypothetical protein
LQQLGSKVANSCPWPSGLKINLLKYRYVRYAVDWNHNRTVSEMILTIALVLLQIQPVPQNSISTLSTATAENAGAAAPDTSTAISTDVAEPANSASVSESRTPEASSQGPGLTAHGASAGPLSLSLLQDHSERLRHRDWLALSITQHGAATFDAWSTRDVIASGQGRELNPMLRPFAGNGSLYAVAQVGPIVFDYLGRRMMTSQHNWIRRAWWVPQAVNTIVLLASGAHNLSIR